LRRRTRAARGRTRRRGQALPAPFCYTTTLAPDRPFVNKKVTYTLGPFYKGGL
jgi:hypothetical protein